jgi:hypothetical protein
MVVSMDKNIICMSDNEFYAWVANNPQYSHLEEEVKAIIAQLEEKQEKELKRIGFELSFVYEDGTEHEGYFDTKEELIEYLNKHV